MIQVRNVGLHHVARVKFLNDFKGAITLTQPERDPFIDGLLLIVDGHHHAGQQHEHDDALHQNMPTDFVSPNPLEHRAVVVAKTRLEVMNEQRPDASDEQPERYVNEPMNAEVENGEDEQQRVEQNEQMVGPVPPFPQGSTLFPDMEVICLLYTSPSPRDRG